MNDIKKVAMIFGAVLLLIGILGFVPGVTTNNMLLGIFMVNTAHNLVHLLTGAAALLAAYAGFSRLYFKIFGVVYTLVTVLGFLTGDALGMEGLIPVDMADNLLHFAIATFSLYMGFAHEAKGREAKEV